MTDLCSLITGLYIFYRGDCEYNTNISIEFGNRVSTYEKLFGG